MSGGMSKQDKASASLRSVRSALAAAERQLALAKQTHDAAGRQVRELALHARELAWEPGAATVLEDVASTQAYVDDLASTTTVRAWDLLAGWTETPPERIEEASDRTLYQVERGVDLKTLADRSCLLVEHYASMLRASEARGEGIRLGDVEAPLVICDDTIVLPLKWSGPTGALVVESPELSRVLVAFFLAVWSAGSRLPREGLPAADRAVLEGLLAGQQDEAIARALGVSVKTVRRRVTALMAQVGATSRFQLGAAAQGLLGGSSS